MTKQKTIITIIILLLVAGNVFLGVKYWSSQKEVKETQSALETQQINVKVLAFTQLFIEKVLKAETEVDFENRLKLENAARDLNDEEIFAQWQKFVGSQTEAEAQENVKDLLEILVNKINAVK